MFLNLSSGRLSRQTSDQPAQNQVGHKRQHDRDGDRFTRIDEVLDDNLVHDIEHQRQHENSPDTLPSVFDPVGVVGWVRDEGPEKRRLAGFSVIQTRANREKGSHKRLQHKPELHRPTGPVDQVAKETGPYIVHNVSLLLVITPTTAHNQPVHRSTSGKLGRSNISAPALRQLTTAPLSLLLII